MINHLTYLTYNHPLTLLQFNLLNLPIDLILQVLSYLDYPEFHNLATTCKFLYQLASYYHSYLINLKFQRTRFTINRFLDCRPTVNELYHKRILKHRFIHILIQPYIWNRLEMFEVLAFMLKKKSLNKLLSRRPTKIELIKKGILKPGRYNSIDELDNDFIKVLSKPVLTRKIANKIKTLENYKLEEILRSFVKKCKLRKDVTENQIVENNDFLEKLNFFEKFTNESISDEQIVELGCSKKKKKILKANVIGNKVVFN